MVSLNHDETELAVMWQQFADGRDKCRRDRLIEAYLPLVEMLSRNMSTRLSGHMDADDLASAGAFGLMAAIESYDLGRGTTFEAYARPRIAGAMLDYVRQCDWVPRSVRCRNRRRASAVETFETIRGRRLTDDELVEAMGASGAEARKLVSQRTPTVTPLDRSGIYSDEGQELLTTPALRREHSPDPADGVIRKDLKEFLLRSLNQQERQVILLYYYENLTMKEVGAAMGISQTRVSQIHNAICRHLRERLAGRSADL